MPPRCSLSCPRNNALPKARQVLLLRPAAHQLQVTLASNLHTPADRSTARGKASARAAPRSTSTSKQSTRPVRCQPLQLIVPAEHRIAQDKASARAASRRTLDFKLRWRRISTRQLTEALPKAGPVLVLHLAAHQLQRSAPVRCDATPPQLIMPAEQSIAQGKASARAAPRSTPTSSHASVESPHAS